MFFIFQVINAINTAECKKLLKFKDGERIVESFGMKLTDKTPEAGSPQIGYHYLVYRNGVIATGRDVPEIGAHVQGYNQKSIGICLIGTDRFTPAQWQSLAELIGALRQRYPDSRVVGHRDLSPDLNANGIVEQFEWLKTCPNFDVAAWVARGMSPIPESTEEVQ